MKRYETTFLIAPNLPEDETEKLIGKMSEIISKNNGKMIGMDKWGKRKLAYQIEKFDEAFYVVFNYESEPDIPVELERRFKQTEAIIRYLTVKELVSVRGRKKDKSPPVEEQQAEKLEKKIEEVKKTEEVKTEEVKAEEVKETEEVKAEEVKETEEVKTEEVKEVVAKEEEVKKPEAEKNETEAAPEETGQEEKNKEEGE